MSKYKVIPLDGKLITAVDGILANGNDFTVLQNYRYITQGVKGITPAGTQTKINTTALASNPYLRSGIHFKKDSPAESHVLVQAFVTAGTSSKIYDNKTAIPNQGDFETTPVYTSAGTYCGRFNLLPDDSVGFFADDRSLVWGGDETRCGMFVNYDYTSNAWSYDFTDAVNNTLTDDANIATIKADSSTKTYVLIGAQRPIKGIKWYVQTPNTGASSSVKIYQWTAAGWATVGTVTDNTKTGTVCLAKTGTTTFATTETTAKANIRYGVMQYFYLCEFTAVDDTTQIYYCTLDMPMQGFTDLWDGVPRKIAQFWKHTAAGKDVEYTSNVVSQDVFQIADGSYADYTFFAASSLDTSAYLVVCSHERASGIVWTMVKDRCNDVSAAVMNVFYWDGDSWVEVDQLLDLTADTGATTTSLQNSGMSTWTPPDADKEFRTSVVGDSKLWCYKVTFDAQLDSSVYIDCINTIPAQKTINDYAFGFTWQNRPVLLREISGAQNGVMVGSAHSVCTFNGADSWSDRIGNGSKLTAGGALYTRFSDAKYEDAIICTQDKTYLLSGTSPSGDDKFRVRVVSEIYGCTDPNTFDSCVVTLANGEMRNIAVWKAATDIVIFDGASVYPISDDIGDLFNPKKASCIVVLQSGITNGKFDPVYGEYHWWYDGPSERVFNPRKMAWSVIDHSPSTYAIIPVMSTYGNKYCYGCTYEGYLERLDYGSSSDGAAVVHKFRTADNPLGQGETSLIYPTKIERIKLFMVANSSVDAVTVKVYDDALTAGYTAPETASQVDSTHRVVKAYVTPNDADWGIFHAIECSATMDDISTGFEILGMAVEYVESSSPDMGG